MSESKNNRSCLRNFFNSFVKLVDEVYDERTLIAFELSKDCNYWRWPMVRKFLTLHHFDGCMLGVLGNNNQPRKKSWTIAGNFEELSQLDSYRSDDSHEHDQSRGKALKLAANYTFKLTDMLHECFRVAGVGQASKRNAKLACRVKMADSRPAADPASREATLEATRKRNKEWCADIHSKLLFAMVIRHQGEGQNTCDFVEGLLNKWTPASAIRFFCKDDPLAEALKFCILPEEAALEDVNPPAATPCPAIIWILVSGSCCALITGRRNTLRKYDLAELFKERKPDYVIEWINEMDVGQGTSPNLSRKPEPNMAMRQGSNFMWLGSEMSWWVRQGLLQIRIGQSTAPTVICPLNVGFLVPFNLADRPEPRAGFAESRSHDRALVRR